MKRRSFLQTALATVGLVTLDRRRVLGATHDAVQSVEPETTKNLWNAVLTIIGKRLVRPLTPNEVLPAFQRAQGFPPLGSHVVVLFTSKPEDHFGVYMSDPFLPGDGSSTNGLEYRTFGMRSRNVVIQCLEPARPGDRDYVIPQHLIDQYFAGTL